jgi:hypothetical protein
LSDAVRLGASPRYWVPLDSLAGSTGLRRISMRRFLRRPSGCRSRTAGRTPRRPPPTAAWGRFVARAADNSRLVGEAPRAGVIGPGT